MQPSNILYRHGGLAKSVRRTSLLVKTLSFLLALSLTASFIVFSAYEEHRHEELLTRPDMIHLYQQSVIRHKRTRSRVEAPMDTSVSPLQTTLYQMGMHNVSDQIAFLEKAPSWEEISKLYYSTGEEPKIYGLDQCEAFRQGNKHPVLAVAGTFNSGTNLLSHLMAQNCDFGGIASDRVMWQVPW